MHVSIYTEFSRTCSNDPGWYQVCGASNLYSTITNEKGRLCGKYICTESASSSVSSGFLEYNGKECDGYEHCSNTKLDESECGDVVTLPSGRRTSSVKICNGECDDNWSCEDEADCRGYIYGMYCYKDGGYSYIQAMWICNGYKSCYGEDDLGCQVGDNTTHIVTGTCVDSWRGVVVNIFNFTRCAVIFQSAPYCEDYTDQTNCSDTSKTGLTCSINGYTSTVAKSMICQGFEYPSLCDDEIDKACVAVSPSCTLHKHLLCDGRVDCVDETDEENEICESQTVEKCIRQGGDRLALSSPLAWLTDGTKDCVHGEDEEVLRWPTCGSDATKRYVTQNTICQDVFLCGLGDLRFIEFENLCDGIETCGNENGVCKAFRDKKQVFKNALTVGTEPDNKRSYFIA